MTDHADTIRRWLNDLLFQELNADVTKVIWIGKGRWLVIDCETPELFVVEMYPAKTVRDAD